MVWHLQVVVFDMNLGENHQFKYNVTTTGYTNCSLFTWLKTERTLSCSLKPEPNGNEFWKDVGRACSACNFRILRFTVSVYSYKQRQFPQCRVHFSLFLAETRGEVNSRRSILSDSRSSLALAVRFYAFSIISSEKEFDSKSVNNHILNSR